MTHDKLGTDAHTELFTLERYRRMSIAERDRWIAECRRQRSIETRRLIVSAFRYAAASVSGFVRVAASRLGKCVPWP